jgi:hypothetical protein
MVSSADQEHIVPRGEHAAEEAPHGSGPEDEDAHAGGMALRAKTVSSRLDSCRYFYNSMIIK